jgi:short-chain fatty acids transporter
MAQDVGVDRAPLVMAFAYGDQTTNLMQPFWALPVLAITGLKARQIFGYTLIAMAVEVCIILPCLMIFG